MSPEEFWSQRFPNDAKLKQQAAVLRHARSCLAEAGVTRRDATMVKLLEDGTLDIRVNTPDLNTLEPLAELPISILNIKSASITDLSRLAKLTKLRRLCMRDIHAKDLSPLAACGDLEVLNAGGNPISDLAPLRGLPITSLIVENTKVTDLSPLAGMPLHVLRVDRCDIATAEPLLSCRDLEWLGINRETKDLDNLRGMPKLTRISYEWEALTNPRRTHGPRSRVNLPSNSGKTTTHGKPLAGSECGFPSASRSN